MAKQILPRATAAGGVERRRGAWGARLGTVLLLFCAGATVAAQDRVLLHDSAASRIREIEITHGGRAWSTSRIVELPTQLRGVTLLPLADGSRLVGIVRDPTTQSSLLVQYEVVTGRASVLDVGRFDLDARIVVDKSAVQMFVVESARAKVTFLDARLRPEPISLPEPRRITGAFLSDGYLVLQRYSADRTTSTELIVIDVARREAVRTWLFDGSPRFLLFNGGRIYREYWNLEGTSWVKTLDHVSLQTGEVLGRATGVTWSYFLQYDESRGLLLHDADVYLPGPNRYRQTIVARDPLSLAVVGELPMEFGDRRLDWKLAQTTRERAILLFNRNPIGGYIDNTCAGASPRIDVFDGRTFALVNRIDLQRSCPAIIPLPR